MDDYGRGQADPQLIKGHCFPRMDKVTLKQIDAALVTLARKGCITLYDVDGDSYFYFPTWADHQRIQTKRSKYPGVEDGEIRNPTVGHGESPSESNTIQSNKNPNTNTTRTSANVQRHKYGQYNNVLLSDDDLLKLQNEFPVDWKERNSFPNTWNQKGQSIVIIWQLSDHGQGRTQNKTLTKVILQRYRKMIVHSMLSLEVRREKNGFNSGI